MLEYSSVCYKNTFLNQVIVRVDFAQFIQTNMVFDENIEKEILKIFPRRGKDQIIRFNSINVVFDQKKMVYLIPMVKLLKEFKESILLMTMATS